MIKSRSLSIQLHWLKDVLLAEDRSKIRTDMAAQNFSIVLAKVLNLFPKNGYFSATKTQRMFANNINYSSTNKDYDITLNVRAIRESPLQDLLCPNLNT